MQLSLWLLWLKTSAAVPLEANKKNAVYSSPHLEIK